MDRRITLWVVIAVLFAATLFLTFKAGSIDVGSVQAPALAAKSAAQSASAMVGGC
ncbi:MAG: hypothetical protein Q8P57_00060 [Candidatus Pacearchaeota archaeon]|nr:hypothetical protein [Candidatus Pacearchaeota archaeon]